MAGEGSVVVYLGPWPWDSLPNRAQPLALALARAGHEVKYLNPIERPLRRPRWKACLRSNFVAGPGACLQTIARPHRGLEVAEVAADGVVESALMAKDFSPAAREAILPWLQSLRRRARTLRLVMSRHLKRWMFRAVDWDQTVLDIEDPWFERPKGDHPYVRLAIRQALACADLVLANGEGVAEMFRPVLGKPLHVLPNGVDRALVEALEEPWELPAALRACRGRHRILFLGTIDLRIHFQLLAPVMAEFPEIDFCFVGPAIINSWMKRRWNEIRACPNFHHLAPVAFPEVPAFLAHSHAFMLPYSEHGGLRMFPAKLLEYVAAARPILTSRPYDELAPVSGALRPYCDAPELRSALRGLLETDFLLDEATRRACRAFALGNTWDDRAQTLCRWWNT